MAILSAFLWKLTCHSWGGGTRISIDPRSHFSMSLPNYSLPFPYHPTYPSSSWYLSLGYFCLAPENWWLQCTLNLWKVLERTVPCTFLTNSSQFAPKFLILALKGPCPYKPFSHEKTGMIGHLSVDLFLHHNCQFPTLVFYFPQIYLKFCLKQNASFLFLRNVRITTLHGKFTFLSIIKSEWVTFL